MLQSNSIKILIVLDKVQEKNTIHSEVLHSYLNDSVYNLSVYCFYFDSVYNVSVYCFYSGSDLPLVSESKFMGNHITLSGMINSILHG